MKRLIFGLILTLFSSNLFALPLPGAGKVEALIARGLPPSLSSNYDFEGIVALSNCSGSLVRFEDSRDTDLAMVLTNGHCFEGGLLQPGKVLVNTKSNRSFTLLSKTASPLGKVKAQKVLYATMTKTDMALYQLELNYAQILTQFNIAPLTLASDYAEKATDIEILSGYWKRGYSCRHDGLVFQMKEGDWLWEDSIRYSQPGCETIPGTSGSPIIAKGTKVVIGVNNTGNENGEKCTQNNPCEIDQEGKITNRRGLIMANKPLGFTAVWMPAIRLI